MPQKYGNFFYLFSYFYLLNEEIQQKTYRAAKFKISTYILFRIFPAVDFLYTIFFFSVNAMGITFGILTQGSAFWHGSETLNGASADVVINDLFAYVAYQAAVENLLPKESSIIHELSLSPRFVFTIL